MTEWGLEKVVQNIIDRGVGFCLWAAMCMGGVPGLVGVVFRGLFGEEKVECLRNYLLPG